MRLKDRVAIVTGAARGIRPGLLPRPGARRCQHRRRGHPVVHRKRIEEPADLAGTVIFLASEDSDFISGQTINVNGGATHH